MKKDKIFTAVDLGAESGRVMLVKFSDKGISLEEIHRFTNGPVKIATGMHWDVLKLFNEIKTGLGKIRTKVDTVDGIGLDTWGVDFALLDSNDNLLYNPYHYRDPRTDGMMEKAFSIVPRERIFEETGIQFMQINSLYQFFAMKNSPIIDKIKTFLTIPDLLNFWLSGVKTCEFTNTTTTQMYDQRAKNWIVDTLRAFGLPTDIFPPVIQPGTVLGGLADFIAGETGLAADIPVIAPACHDTGSAVAAVPAVTKNFAYISSGTWSLVGLEVPEPTINPKSLAANLTNEGGVEGTVRLLKNVTGLWLVQECRRIWATEGDSYSYAELAQLAQNAPPSGIYVDPDSMRFLHPDHMPRAIQEACRATNQTIPDSKESILRCIFESLALKYRYVLQSLEGIHGKKIDTVHIIGGGSQNELLNQLTSDASGKNVVAGPVEATALGNALVQAVASGLFNTIWDGRKILSEQLESKTYTPVNASGYWDEAYSKFVKLMTLESV